MLVLVLLEALDVCRLPVAGEQENDRASGCPVSFCATLVSADMTSSALVAAGELLCGPKQVLLLDEVRAGQIQLLAYQARVLFQILCCASEWPTSSLRSDS